MYSLAEENYLKAIFHLSEGGRKNVSTNALAKKLDTKPASVTDMLRKLYEKELVAYEKYQGVNISDTGKDYALMVIRKHRLWETFLVDTLGFGWDEVHSVAEQLEHIRSHLLIERLDNFLGNPKYDPHGEPIPDAQGNYKLKKRTLVSEMIKGGSGKIVAVKVSDTSFLHYLDKLKIEIGTHIDLLDIVAFDQSVCLLLNKKNEVYISNSAASNIFCELDNT